MQKSKLKICVLKKMLHKEKKFNLVYDNKTCARFIIAYHELTRFRVRPPKWNLNNDITRRSEY